MKQVKFAQLEALLEHLLEDNLARLFSRRLRLDELAARLARAMEDGIRVEDSGLFAPNEYVISLHAEDFQALSHVTSDLKGWLTTAITKAVVQADCQLSGIPTVQIRIDTALIPRTFTISAGYVDTPRHSTKLFVPLENEDQSAFPQVRNPQLIIRGSNYIPLRLPVINIGRRRDNQIVIDEPKVSRVHAQIRLRFGRYVIYDLGSSGGTFVNEHRITECILNSGDVISLAGVMMLYVDDEPAIAHNRPKSGTINDTQPMDLGANISDDAQET
ncbi:MAG: DUF3662 domain-containing protein [Anaerolineae bacterium]|nr:DUF3662 domain-containing protein [Anaerolineae bacterium]